MVVASQATLEIVAKAKDEFSDELRRGLRRLRGDIDRNVTQPSRVSTRALAGLATAFTGLASVVVLQRLGREALSLGRELSSVASEATELRNRLQLTFGESGSRQIRAFAEELREATGRGILDTEETAGAFQVLFTGLGVTRQEAAKLSQEATKLTTDFSSFFDIDPGQTRQSLIAGLVGEIEVLRRRFNVAVNDQLLRAEALRLGYVELGEALNPAARAVATLSLAARQQQVAIGDAERTSGEFANTIRNIGSQVRDVKAAIGEELNRELLTLIENLGGVGGVVALAEGALGTFKNAAVGFVEFLATDGVDTLASFLEGIRSLASLPGIDFDTTPFDNFLDRPIFQARRLRREIDELEARIEAAPNSSRDTIFTGGLFETRTPTSKLRDDLEAARAELTQLEAQFPDVARALEDALREPVDVAGLLAPSLDFSDAPGLQLPNFREQIAAQFAQGVDLELPEIPALVGLDAFADTAPEFEALTDEIIGTADALGVLDRTAREALDSLVDTEQATRAEIEAKTGYTSIIDLTQKNQEKFTLSAVEQKNRILENYRATLQAIEGFKRYGATKDQVTEAEEAATRAMEDQIEKIKGLAPPIDSATDAFLRFGAVAGRAVLSANREIAKAKDATVDLGGALQSGLASGFAELAPAIDRSTNALANFAGALARSIQIAASSELASRIAGSISAAFAGGFNISEFQSRGLDSFNFTNASGFNVFGKGTPLVDEPQLAVVGDTAEAIVPLPDGRSIPVQFRGESGQSGGGGSAPNVTFNVSAMDSASVAQFFERNRDRIAEQMIESFYEKSNFRQVFTDQREF